MPYLTLEDEIDATLLESRRLFFSDQVDNDSASAAVKKLWYLELKNPGKPITFIINSPGGSVDAGFAIWDQVKMISSPVTTVVTGLAASMGSVLSLCAEKGRRFATPHARFMIHQPAIHGVIQGQASDIEIQAKEMLKTHNMLVDLYTEKTGKPREEIERSLDRDTWFSAKEALDGNFIDKIITSFTEI